MLRSLRFFLLCIFFCVSLSLSAQFQSPGLGEVKAKYESLQKGNEERIEKFLKKSKSGRVVIRRDGTIMLLVDVSPFGNPIYIRADNAEVATSLSVDELRQGGSLGLNLEGSGIEVGIWDEGRVRNDHIEYIGRVVQGDSPSPTFVLHATHVLGTMIAAGLNANAKGMAPKATAIAFDFNGDVGEMADQATPDQTSIILSNHSYGTLSGWDNDGGTWVWHGDASISNVRDWKFGFYNSTSNFYDDIAFNAPYYLIVKSVGNDRSDVGDGSRPPDCDPFDCIPTNGVAKNILTVGAVKKLAGPYTSPSDVEITSFSSFGPADDGRIKPDLVAPGQAVISTAASTSSAYAPLSGTSMSAPATTGTLALLQELHKNLNGGNLMKAATLKALAIHTARETGTSIGPDYQFGWGLLDAEGAAKLLIDRDDQNVFVKELRLNNSEVFELSLTPKENTKITATLVWNDPAGPVLAPALNPTTKMLVNDLDLSLVDDGGTTQFPWKLNPTSPALAATKGNNSIDNVEKLEFDQPQPRDYKLRVAHKGTLVNGFQDFSLILTYSSVVDPKTTFYWVDNGGNWNDGAHWSLSSGGPSANTLPGIDNNVVFDENSFTLDNQTVNLTQDQECFSLRWFANENIALEFNNHLLTVASGMNLLSDKINNSTAGTIHFLSSSGANAVVNLNNNVWENVSTRFSGESSEWTLSGDFSVNGIQLESGRLKLGKNSITISQITTPGIAQKHIEFDETVVNATNTLNIDFSDTEVKAETASIKISTGLNAILNFGSGTVFDGTLNLSGGVVTVAGSGEIGKVKGFGQIATQGDFEWREFSLNSGSKLILQESSEQLFSDKFNIQSVTSNRSSIESTGSLTATVRVEKNQKICLDNLDISNIAQLGEATVGVGLNSTLTNSTGWIQKNCSDILFADFDVDFTCEKSSVFFEDQSSGPITTRTWNFGDQSSSQNQSELENPIHFFEAGGAYTVSLVVSDGQQSDEYSQLIQLTPNILQDNQIELNNGKLISFLPASKYQWTLDGVLLENTNVRSIDFSNGFGEYAVLIFDEECNRRSAPFLVTGISEGINVDDLIVFPNPAKDFVYVRSPREIVSVSIMTGLGKQVLSHGKPSPEGYKLDTSDLSSGFYILYIQLLDSVAFRRILVR